MRLIVDEMPKDTIDCPFGRVFTYLYSDQIKQTKCSLADGGPCELKDGACPWLKKLNNDTELYQSVVDDASYVEAMKTWMSWFGE